MSARSKRRGKKASFHGINIKLQRADIQMRALESEFDRIVDGNLYPFVPEIHDEGRTHIYKAVNPPPVGVFWGAQIGEIVHSLRSALDHLAWQLVIAGGNTPNNRTQFPVCEGKPKKRIVKYFPYPRKKSRLRISGEVPPRALALIEAIQPYYRTDESRRISAINKLDIFDKHRELIVTATAVHMGSTHYDSDGRKVTMQFPGRPIKDGEIVAIVKYDPPQLEPDPNLVFTPFVTFAEGSPFAGELVFRFLWELIFYLMNDLMVKFDEWVPMKGAPPPL
jgi:hypothetical protein